MRPRRLQPLNRSGVADCAGIAEGTIFRAFGSKDELIQAAVARHLDPEPFRRQLRAIDPLLPLEVDIDGKAIFEHGNEITVVVKSQVGATCELTVRWPDATEAPQQSMAADARGRCSYKVRVPSTVPNGLGLMKGSVRQGGRVSNQTVEFEIVTDVQ